MLVELTDDNCWYNKGIPEVVENFFKEHGEFKKEEKQDKDGDKYFTYDFKAIAYVDDVPIEVLNHGNVAVKFYKSPVKVMSENISSMIGKGTQFTEAAQNISIHLPSNELISYNDVTWLEDVCTQELQRVLDEGYRIIACIPQVGNRRPDYVLGRKV